MNCQVSQAYGKGSLARGVIREVRAICKDPHTANDEEVSLCIGKLLEYLNGKLRKGDVQAVSMLMQLQRRQYDLAAMKSQIVVARPNIVTV